MAKISFSVKGLVIVDNIGNAGYVFDTPSIKIPSNRKKTIMDFGSIHKLPTIIKFRKQSMNYWRINTDKNSRKNDSTCDLWYKYDMAFTGDYANTPRNKRHDKHLAQLIPEDGIFMHHSGMGIVGYGLVKEHWNGKFYTGDERLLYREEPYEYRIAVEWDPAYDCRQNPVSVQGLYYRSTSYPVDPETALRLLGQLRKNTIIEGHTSSLDKKVMPAFRVSSYADFGDAPNDDPAELQQFAARVRRGQLKFRENLLKAYDNKCSILGHGPKDVLEAVHIEPHAKTGINELDNGLIMRCDLHSLFDAHLLRINPENLSIVIDPSLRGTPYWELRSKTIRAKVDGSQIGTKYLRQRWGSVK